MKSDHWWGLCRFWWALPGAQSPWRVLRSSKWLVEPFQALGVIQAQGKLTSNRRVKNWCKWARKMKISQNPWVRLTSKHFSLLPWVKTYPGIDLLCQSMRFTKSCTAGQVFSMTHGSREFHEKWSLVKSMSILAALPGHYLEKKDIVFLL